MYNISRNKHNTRQDYRKITRSTSSKHIHSFCIFGFLVIVTLLIIILNLERSNYNVDHAVEPNFAFYNLTEDQHEYVNKSEIIRRISKINVEQKIRNEEIFGTFNNYSLVIVVQVHSRISYLEYLIESLRKAQGIEKTLLVFSHDFFSERINKLVNSIKFCKFLQIFYPHSVQIHPDVFPGRDKNDCHNGVTMEEALKIKCTNVLHADAYGNYRNPYLIQAKHHWWWKASRVFDLSSLQSHSGLVLFLEEDNYVLEDFIHVLKLMEDITKYSYTRCKLLALARNWNSESVYERTMGTYTVAITNIFSNYGMAFNRAVWRDIAKCKRAYCCYDDYNLDFSLRNVYVNCMKQKYYLVLYAARVFHLGTCGLHNANSNCNPALKLEKLKNLLQKGSKYLFPTQLLLVRRGVRQFYKAYGGWNDPRDHAFCMGMTMR